MHRSGDFTLTDAERLTRTNRRRRLFAAAVGLVLLVAFAAVVARPTRRAVKAWQARRHANHALALIREQNWTEARNKALAAYQLSSTEPEAIRAVARLLTATRDTEAFEFWDRLKIVAPLSRDDLRAEARLALFVGDGERGQDAVAELMKRDAEPADLLLEAEFAAQAKKNDTAQRDCEKVLSDSRSTREQRFEATVVELALGASAVPDVTAWSRLRELTKSDDVVALSALLLLAQKALSGQVQEHVKNNLAELSKAIETHPLAHAAAKLAALDLLEKAGIYRREALIERGIAQFKNGDTSDLAALAGWLNSKGEYQRVVDSISPPMAAKARPLFLQYLDALGGLGQWNDIKRLLEGGGFPLDAVLEAMYLARCNAQLGNQIAATNSWQRAIESAARDAGKLVQVGDFGEKNGNLDIADRAYLIALHRNPKLRPAYQGRLRVAQAHGDTQRMHELLSAMIKLWPNDTAIQNDEAYMRLLLLDPLKLDNASSAQASTASELREIEKLAEKLVQEEPKSLPHRTLLALARLRSGLPASALDAYGIQVPKEAITPSALAVRAAALAGNGRSDEARALLAKLQPDQLLPEERALISDL